MALKKKNNNNKTKIGNGSNCAKKISNIPASSNRQTTMKKAIQMERERERDRLYIIMIRIEKRWIEAKVCVCMALFRVCVCPELRRVRARGNRAPRPFLTSPFIGRPNNSKIRFLLQNKSLVADISIVDWWPPHPLCNNGIKFLKKKKK